MTRANERGRFILNICNNKQVMSWSFHLYDMVKRVWQAVIVIALISSCNSGNDTAKRLSANEENKSSAKPSRRENVLTSADQKAFTAEKVIDDLKEGNKHYVQNRLTSNDYLGMMHRSMQGQYPEAFILSCIDSRVPVEEVFDKAIGDVFVGRVAGNFVDEDMLGSMEYGCKVSGAKLIVVMGHESCGAIKAAIEKERLGNITAMLSKIKPALEMSKDFVGERTIENHAFVERVVKDNVINTVHTIPLKSAVLKEMLDKGEIKIVGAYYSFETGEVSFLNEK
jgi:carbonic anhydrase